MNRTPSTKPHKFSKLLRQPSINLLYDSEVFALRFPKYCKSLLLRIKSVTNPNCTRKLKRCQRLSSIRFSGLEKAPLKPLFRILQSQKNYLISLKGAAPEAIPFCPKIKTYHLDVLSSASWRGLSYLQKIEKMVLTIPYKDELQKNFITFLVSKRLDWYREMSRERLVPSDTNLQEHFWKTWIEQNEKKLWRRRLMDQMMWHLKKLKQLKSLKITARSFNSRIVSIVMGKLNQEKEFLEKQKRIIVDICLTHPGDLSSDDFKCPQLFGNITKLTLGDAILPASHYLLSDMARFENLRYLEIDKTRYENLEYYTQKKGVNFFVFECLGALKHLLKINIGVVLGLTEHLKQFLKVFSLPKGIESIKLTLLSVTWKDILQESKNLMMMSVEERNPFENSICYVNFFNKWRDLEKLKDLQLTFKDTNDLEVPTMYFLNSLMQRLGNLQNLHYINESATTVEKKEDFDFGLFWNSIQNLRDSLKMMSIRDKSLALHNFEGNLGEMPRLENLRIFGEIKGSNSLDRIITHNKKCGRADYMRIVTIKTIKMLGKQDLLTCFENLLKKSRKVYVEVYLDIKEITPDFFIQEFEKFAGKSKSESLLSLSIMNSQRLDPNERKRISKIVEKNPVFITFSVNTIDNETFHYM